MLTALYLASFVDIVLFRYILIVLSQAFLVLVFFLSYSNLSPPTVSLVRLISSVCNQMLQQHCVYIIFLSFGTCFLLMKLIVSDLLTRCVPFLFHPTPFNSFLNLFDADLCHNSRVSFMW